MNGLTKEKEEKQLTSNSEEHKTQSDRSKEPEPETAEDIAKQVCVARRMNFMRRIILSEHLSSLGSHNNERESPHTNFIHVVSHLRGNYMLYKHEWQAKAKLTNFYC